MFARSRRRVVLDALRASTQAYTSTSYVVVTPPVPRWRVNDDAVTAKQWLRKHLRHVPSDGERDFKGPHAGAAVFKLFRDRRVRVGTSAEDGRVPDGRLESARGLRRASRARTLTPGEFLCVPDGASGYWASWSDADQGGGENIMSDRDWALGEGLRARVRYRDEHVVVVDKPSGLATVPGAGNEVSVYDLRHTLEAPYVVHRLDRDTSGVLVLARTSFAANKLNAMFQRKSKTDFAAVLRAEMERGKAPRYDDSEIQRTYWAICANPPPRGTLEGWIDAPLADTDEGDGRGDNVRLVGGWRVYDVQNGDVIVGAGEQEFARVNKEENVSSRAATTRFKVLASAGDDGPTLLELVPITGRKHQLRVHLSKALSSPIVGDYKYGFTDKQKPWRARFAEIERFERERASSAAADRDDVWRALRRDSLRGASKLPLHLHAHSIKFSHPEGDRSVRVVAEPPSSFVQALDAFGLSPRASET